MLEADAYDRSPTALRSGTRMRKQGGAYVASL